MLVSEMDTTRTTKRKYKKTLKETSNAPTETTESYSYSKQITSGTNAQPRAKSVK
jgi:hypothetical protein